MATLVVTPLSYSVPPPQNSFRHRGPFLMPPPPASPSTLVSGNLSLSPSLSGSSTAMRRACASNCSAVKPPPLLSPLQLPVLAAAASRACISVAASSPVCVCVCVCVCGACACALAPPHCLGKESMRTQMHRDSIFC